MKAQKSKHFVFTDERPLKILTLSYRESDLLTRIVNYPQRNRLDCLASQLVLDLNLPPLPLFIQETKELYVQVIHKFLKNLAQQQLIVFDPQADLIYLSIYLCQFPLKNFKESREAKRLIYAVSQEATFYSLLVFDLFQMNYLTGIFRNELKRRLSNSLQQGVIRSC